ncbi:MAG TPA: urease accessory protein UreD [Stellaceae bacterium]
MLFPAPADGEPPVAVLVTTSGGLVAGDRLDIAVRVEAGARAHVTASAAEKIYRSLGATAEISQRLTVGAGAVLEFLPPETILFDGARLRRKTVVELAERGAFLGGDIVVFGRRAGGERFTKGLLHETWEVWRDRRLVWGDALHLDGDIPDTIADPACFDGAAGFATLILAPVGRDPREFIEGARAVQATAIANGMRAGATVLAGLLIARWLAADTLALRGAFAALASRLRAEALALPPVLPRLWQV